MSEMWAALDTVAQNPNYLWWMLLIVVVTGVATSYQDILFRQFHHKDWVSYDPDSDADGEDTQHQRTVRYNMVGITTGLQRIVVLLWGIFGLLFFLAIKAI